MDKRKIFRSAFLAIVIIHLLGHLFDLGSSDITKPLLIPSLMLYFIFSSTNRSATYMFVISALTLSWIGDVLLMFQDQKPMYFILGLVSFLIAHLIYAHTYTKAKEDKPTNPLLNSQKLRHSLTLILAGTALVYILLPGLGDMKVPVILYASVLVIMGISALLRYGYTSMRSFGLVFGGAMVFMISDSLLAINKFLDPIPFSGFWIMLTYCLAQYFIVEGLISHDKKNQ